jgi:hypothetical protein
LFIIVDDCFMMGVNKHVLIDQSLYKSRLADF